MKLKTEGSQTIPSLPSCMVRAIGLRVKSGWLFPSGIVSMNCVIITPGTRDLFLIPTVSMRKWNVTDSRGMKTMQIQRSNTWSMQRHILTQGVLECFMLTAPSRSRSPSVRYSRVPLSLFFFLVQVLTVEVHPENRYEVWTYISTHNQWTLGIINQHIRSIQFLMPGDDDRISWLMVAALSVPSLPLKWSSSRSDDEHGKEHI